MNQNRLGAFVIQQCHGPLAARQQRTREQISVLYRIFITNEKQFALLLALGPMPCARGSNFAASSFLYGRNYHACYLLPRKNFKKKTKLHAPVFNRMYIYLPLTIYLVTPGVIC